MSRAPRGVEPVKMPPCWSARIAQLSAEADAAIATPGLHIGGMSHDERNAEMFPSDFAVTDHAAAAAEILERYAKRLRSGDNTEDVARELLPIVRVMARRT